MVRIYGTCNAFSFYIEKLTATKFLYERKQPQVRPVADISLGPLWPRPQALGRFLYTIAHCSKEAQLIYRNEPMEWPQALGQPSSATAAKPTKVLVLISRSIPFMTYESQMSELSFIWELDNSYLKEKNVFVKGRCIHDNFSKIQLGHP